MENTLSSVDTVMGIVGPTQGYHGQEHITCTPIPLFSGALESPDKMLTTPAPREVQPPFHPTDKYTSKS